MPLTLSNVVDKIHGPPQSVDVATKKLDKLKFGILWKSEEMAAEAGISIYSIQTFRWRTYLRDYCHLVHFDGARRTVYGSKKTITELKRRLDADKD